MGEERGGREQGEEGGGRRRERVKGEERGLEMRCIPMLRATPTGGIITYLFAPGQVRYIFLARPDIKTKMTISK